MQLRTLFQPIPKRLQELVNLLIVAVFALHAANRLELPLLSRLDLGLHDLMTNLTLPAGTDDRLVIIDIDERSLRQLGHWPWRRELLAQLTDAAYRDGVAVLSFDAVFADPDGSAWLWSKLAQEHNPVFRRLLAQARDRYDQEGLFAHSLKSGASVLGYYFNFEPERTGVLPAPWFDGTTLPRPGDLPPLKGYGGNLADLQANVRAGYLNVLADEDGSVRRLPLLLSFEGRTYPTLSLALAGAAFDGPPQLLPGTSALGPDKILTLGDIRIPLDADGTIYVPYRAEQAFRHVSALDVLEHKIDPRLLEGRIAIVGATAPGLVDLRPTPIDRKLPGVEIHASVLSGLLDDRLAYRPQAATAIDLAATLAIGILLAAAFLTLRPYPLAASVLLLASSLVAAHVLAWRMHWVVPMAGEVAMFLALLGANLAFGFVTGLADRREKLQLAKLFGQYVPKEIVEKMQADARQFSMKGESRVLTVMFADIRNFTSMSERLASSDVCELLNLYLTRMTSLIYARRGTVDKYIGDAIMAFWGAPIDNPAHPDDALATALAMRAAMPDLNQAMQDRGWPAIGFSIGINSGPMTVGNLGSSYRVAYTVISDAVNLASRLEGAAKQYGLDILVGENTARMTSDIAYLEVDRIRVKGRQEPVSIYWPIGEKGSVAEDLADACRRFQAMLEHYRRGEWARANELLETIADSRLESLRQVYRTRVRHYLEAPPSQWDGVWAFGEK